MKNKTLISIVWITSIVIIILTILCYYLKFSSNGISNDPEQWSKFADYFGGILNPFISILNLFVLTYLSLKLVKIEDERNNWTLQELARPYGEIGYNTTPKGIDITVHNYGLGPMVITEIIIKSKTNEIYRNFVELVKPNNINTHVEIVTFDISNNHCAVGKDGEIQLLSLNGNHADLHYLKYLRETKEKLNSYTIEIKYNDMYKRHIGSINDMINFA